MQLLSNLHTYSTGHQKRSLRNEETNCVWEQQSHCQPCIGICAIISLKPWNMHYELSMYLVSLTLDLFVKPWSMCYELSRCLVSLNLDLFVKPWSMCYELSMYLVFYGLFVKPWSMHNELSMYFSI